MNICKERLENTARATKSCHPRETGNIGYTRGKQNTTQYVLDTAIRKR